MAGHPFDLRIRSEINRVCAFYPEIHQDFFVPALLKVVELHNPWHRKSEAFCNQCFSVAGEPLSYPCPTVKALLEGLENVS